MTRYTPLKLTLLVVALGFFAIGLRTGLDWQRFVAIGLLAVAVMIRFVERRERSRQE